MLPDIKLTSGSFYLNNNYLTDKLPEITFPDNDIPNYVDSLYQSNPADAEAVIETEINSTLFSKHFGMDLSACQSFSAELSEPYQVQRRTHKKKRINKKWAKRYGYETKFRKWRINELSLIDRDNFEFEATGRNVELITR